MRVWTYSKHIRDITYHICVEDIRFYVYTPECRKDACGARVQSARVLCESSMYRMDGDGTDTSFEARAKAPAHSARATKNIASIDADTHAQLENVFGWCWWVSFFLFGA